jgi:hypothetical protein
VSPSKCIVLVPVGGLIDPRCEQALHALERRGYSVRRVQGFSAIDFGRCVLASEALAGGYDELMWIDSDIGFQPGDVDRLRAHNLPFTCGIYPKKSRPEFACDFLPGTRELPFGKDGGLHEVRYVGFGFVHTRREVYDAVRTRLELPTCNQRFGKPIVPYFLPLLAADGPGMWYLSEDYAFCERARRCGYRVMMDTTIKLWHVGSYGYSWDDVARAGSQRGNPIINRSRAHAETLVAVPAPSVAVSNPHPTDSRERPDELRGPRIDRRGSDARRR